MSKLFKILFLYPNGTLIGFASSNFALLSGYLKRDGFNNIKLFDCTLYRSPDYKGEQQDDLRASLGQVKKTNYTDYVHLKDGDVYEEFIKIIDEYKPDLIAATLVDSTIQYCLTFLEKIKDRKIPVITGGVGSTFLYKKILNTKLVNYICIGEGEETLVELCNKLYNGKDCSNIQNIYLLDKDGTIKKNSLRPLVNLNDAPIPDFSIYNDDRFYKAFRGKVIRTMQIDSDRGCPYVCTYCASPAMRSTYKEAGCKNYFRIKSWNKLFSDLKVLIKIYKMNFIWFTSETFFTMSDEKFKEFADRYKNEINLPFYVQTRLDTLTDIKVKLLAEMGCENVGVGLEHGSEEIRNNLLNRRMKNEVILESVKLLNKYNIYCSFNNMIGLPDETRENIFETIELNRQISQILNGHHGINVYTFAPFSGTKLMDICLEKKYIKEEEYNPHQLSQFIQSTLNMPSISKDEIWGLEKTLPLYILLPKLYYPDIKIAEKNDNEGKMMFEKLINIKNKMYQ